MRQIVQGRTMAHITRRSLVLAAMAAPFVARSGAYAQTLPGVIKTQCHFRRAEPSIRSRAWCSRGCSNGWA